MFKLFIPLFFFWFFNLNALEFEQIEEGIFVHYGKHEDNNFINKGDISNITIIVGDESVLLVDVGGTPTIGKEIKKYIKNKIGLPISHIVITHAHPDHFLGLSAFKNSDVEIIGHKKILRSLLLNFDFYKEQSLRTTKDKSLTNIENILPSTLVEKTYSINIGNRKILIEAWPSGHTDNDLSVFDIKSKIFISENIFIDRVPSISASIVGWVKNLEEIMKRDIKLIIPGHGISKNKNEAIEPMLSYFKRIINEVREIHKKNKDVDFAQKNVSRNNLENWILFKEYHKRNITRSFTELEWE